MLAFSDKYIDKRERERERERLPHFKGCTIAEGMTLTSADAQAEVRDGERTPLLTSGGRRPDIYNDVHTQPCIAGRKLHY